MLCFTVCGVYDCVRNRELYSICSVCTSTGMHISRVYAVYPLAELRVWNANGVYRSAMCDFYKEPSVCEVCAQYFFHALQVLGL
jgi:hypothetical protein